MIQKKECTKCGAEKPVSEYWARKQSPDGLQHRCKSCQNERFKKYRQTELGIINQIFRNQVSSAKQRGMSPPSYTLEDLSSWLRDQDEFRLIYREWQSSGYESRKAPSCDRIDDRVSYRLDNIRVTTWGDNWDRVHKDERSGVNTKRCKAVDQLTLGGDLVMRHHSINSAARAVGGTYTPVWKVMNGMMPTAYGYRWRYSHLENENFEIK